MIKLSNARLTFGTHAERPGHLPATITRNKRGLPQQVTDQRFGVAVFDERYGWDANGNLQMQDDALNLAGGDRELNYDARDRLTSSWISGYGNESFGWDALDRLRWRNSWSGAETFNYDGTHRLTSIHGPSGTRWYGHDARGNVTGRPGFTHIYDAANRLTETPGVGRFEYDGHGRRTVTWRADGTAKVDFYTVDGKVRYKTDNREGGGTDYVYLGDQLVAEHKGPWRSTRGTIYTHTDHLGTPVVRTNNLAHVYSRDRRTNFGAPLTLNPVEAEAGYTGHIEDPEQGLVYMQQRYYDPSIARFLSVDPVGPLADPGNHFGRYHYALNNPYRFMDPDGTCAGSRITNSDGTCRGTGEYTTQATSARSADMASDGASRTTSGSPGSNQSGTSLGFSAPPIPGWMVDGVAGFGDTLSFGLTSWARGGLQIGSVNYNSGAYLGGQIGGTAYGFALGGVAGLNGGARSVFWSGVGNQQRAASMGVSLERTPIGSALNRYGSSVPGWSWKAASCIYACNASGNAIKVGLQEGRIWTTVERPVLQWRGIPYNVVP